MKKVHPIFTCDLVIVARSGALTAVETIPISVLF